MLLIELLLLAQLRISICHTSSNLMVIRYDHSTGHTIRPRPQITYTSHLINYHSARCLPTTDNPIRLLLFLFISRPRRAESLNPHLYTDLEKTEASPTTTNSAMFETTEQERDHWKEKYDEVRDLFEDAKMEVGESPVFLLGFSPWIAAYGWVDGRVEERRKKGRREADRGGGSGDRLTDLSLSFFLSMVLVAVVRHRLCLDDALLVAQTHHLPRISTSICIPGCRREFCFFATYDITILSHLRSHSHSHPDSHYRTAPTITRDDPAPIARTRITRPIPRRRTRALDTTARGDEQAVGRCPVGEGRGEEGEGGSEAQVGGGG